MYDKFKYITGFDLEDYFRRFVDFITNESQLIMDYYSGINATLDRNAYQLYKDFVKEADKVINIFDLNMDRFMTVDFWELMEYADDIKIKLETIGNFAKFSRSSVKKESYSRDTLVEVSSINNKTLEELIAMYGSTNRDEDWAEMAISNSITQEDYSSDSEVLLNISFKNNSKFFVNSIVDNPEGDKIKGKDLNKLITFEDNDLKVLSYDDTLQQSTEILLGLNKNDNPESPQLGIDPSLVVGSSLKSILLPSVIRQLFEIFTTDDSIKQIQILNTGVSNGALFMDLNLLIQSGEEQQKLLSIGN